MLKPNDKWGWYYDDELCHLMLALDDDMVFKTKLSKKLLVECGFTDQVFTVDDASAFQTFKESCDALPLSSGHQLELVLYCVASRRFHKPVQPKSWFFDSHDSEIEPEEGEVVALSNQLNQGHFIVLEVGDTSSLCACVELEGFALSSSKQLAYGECIKVMHDRMTEAAIEDSSCLPSFAMVG